MQPIAVTAGDPAGVGPELCVRLAASNLLADISPLVYIGSRQLLEQTASALGLTPRWSAFSPANTAKHQLLDVPTAVPVSPGQLDPRNAPSVVKTLELAFDGCVDGQFSAMVTCPVHKGVINDAGIRFTGHTEFLAARAGIPRVVMLLTAGTLRVALATTHLPLSQVSAAINRTMLMETLRILDADLKHKFGLSSPAIAVCGLNPHAGEGGHLGREEMDIIEPALESLRGEGLTLTGPLPADTLFTPRVLERHDAVLAMYHDQGLPVLKHVGFGGAVNVTLGLPVIRTSVDHGTALDIAGKGLADAGSAQAALKLAAQLVRDNR